MEVYFLALPIILFTAQRKGKYDEKAILSCDFFSFFPFFFFFLKNVIPLTLNTITDISIYDLHTCLYKFPLLQMKRIQFTIKAFKVVDHFVHSHDLND